LRALRAVYLRQPGNVESSEPLPQTIGQLLDLEPKPSNDRANVGAAMECDGITESSSVQLFSQNMQILCKRKKYVPGHAGSGQIESMSFSEPVIVQVKLHDCVTSLDFRTII
jgi:hypothetical protein